jgi:isochorismate synthase
MALRADVRANGGLRLSEAQRTRLAGHLKVALRRARRQGRALAALTVTLDGATDPTAVVAASRRSDEPWFCFEQPDRDRTALSALGVVAALEARGPRRFAEVAAGWRALAAAASCDPADGPRGSGLVAVGGFAFAPGGGASPEWAGFAPASMHVPEVALARRGDDVRLTLAALLTPDDTVDAVLARLETRAAELRPSSGLPLLDPDPAHRHRMVSVLPPEHYEHAVAAAVQRIDRGDLEKIVLARAVDVHALAAHDAAAVLGVLRDAFPACHLVCVGRGDAAFVAASPELLIRRDGARAATLALAGSTRRSADPAVDDHLGERLLRSVKDREEHEIVVRRVIAGLRPHSVWVTAAEEPEVVRMANIQHLATPIRAQLATPLDALELAGLMHPTPAVGGEPLGRAGPLIPALEGLDRGWYAGPVGWTDTAGDGEFCVALRCALLRGPIARCYAGNGIVRESDPAAELAETEIKLAALLPLLSG